MRVQRLFGLLAVSLLVHVYSGASNALTPEEPFSSGKVGFSVKFKDVISSYRVNGVSVVPGAELVLEAVGGAASNRFEVEAGAGELLDVSPRVWRWKAPSRVGLYPVTIRNRSTRDSVLLNVFVLVAFSELKGEYLNGYRMGSYPKMPFKRLAIYKQPEGFIEVTKQNENTKVAPHFELRQFLCKQDGGYPKYVAFQESLLLKLELILQKVNEHGYRCDTFHVMSGYRTPYYNKAIGNVRYSRHVWGGAADIFIDVDPEDGMMDDLNKDGKTDYRDAGVLYDIVDDMYGRSFYAPFLGGLGRYKKTSAHGPFVHVDVRGFRARWGR